MIQFLINGVLIGGVYALIALGIVLINKSTGVFNFAIGQMIMLGAFFLWTFNSLGFPIWLSLIMVLVTGAIMGILIERLALRPLIGQPLMSSVLATLALSYVLDALAKLVWGGHSDSLPKFLMGSSLRIGDYVIAHDLLWCFGAAILVFILLLLLYQKTKLGLSMRAVAESHLVAEARGLKIRNIYSITWAIAGIIAVIGGVLLGYRLGVSQFISEVGLKAFPVVLFGGMDSIFGVLVSGLTVGVLENLAGGLIAPWLMESTPYIILVLVLIVKPYGLFGQKRIERI
jgi:branched-chain amino acid transport system permease protein